MQKQNSQFIRGDPKRLATEAFPIPRSGVGAESDMAFFGEANASQHGLQGACMPSASDVGRADRAHESLGARERLPFTQIAIKIKLHPLFESALLARFDIASARTNRSDQPWRFSDSHRPWVRLS